MIKGEKYRPLVVKGCLSNELVFTGKVKKELDTGSSKDFIQVIGLDTAAELVEGFGGYIIQNDLANEAIILKLRNSNIPFILVSTEAISNLISNDIVEINGLENKIKILFKANSDDNILFLTNQCNSNCIMCPDSTQLRGIRSNYSIEKLKRLIELIDNETRNITITGGEPGLLGNDLFQLLSLCKERLPNTNFTLLTNGRIFSIKEFALKFSESAPKKILIAIPIHSNKPEIHDYITGAQNSFKQTVLGIKKLCSMGFKIELRIVVSKINYNHLTGISKFIVLNFTNIARVSFIGLEILGNAVVNKDEVWIPYNVSGKYITNAACYLISNGIKSYIYNYPLCTIQRGFWPIVVHSITDHKVRYRDECNLCRVKTKCGGMFFSTIFMNDLKINPIY